MRTLLSAVLALLTAGLLAASQGWQLRSPPPPPGAGKAPPLGALLNAGEVSALLQAAAAFNFPQVAVAVVDRPGNVLGVYATAGITPLERDTAVGLARTGAFFSNEQAPLSSRTVRFISGLHFPPGVKRTPNAALYGIENTNRGCDLNVTWNAGMFFPRASSLNGLPCDAFTDLGCGTGPVTGKDFAQDLAGVPQDRNPFSVNPGGIPIYRGSFLIGGIGVAGVPGGQLAAAEFAAFSAVSAAGLTPIPVNLPQPQVVFIDGIRLPFVEQRQPPAGLVAAPPGGSFVVPPQNGAPDADGYLVGPLAGTLLSQAEVDQIVQQSIAVANRTRAVIRLPLGAKTRMVIAMGDLDGTLLALYRMPDATVFSIDVAAAKARNVVYFSSLPGANDIGEVQPLAAITNRTLSFGAQNLFPAGIDGSGPGPFFDLYQNDFAKPCSQGFAPPSQNQNGIVFFPGSLPLYRGNTLVGGLGVSGDGVEQDDYVSFHGAQGFLPPKGIWADNRFVSGVRLPFLKFPRNPER